MRRNEMLWIGKLNKIYQPSSQNTEFISCLDPVSAFLLWVCSQKVQNCCTVLKSTEHTCHCCCNTHKIHTFIHLKAQCNFSTYSTSKHQEEATIMAILLKQIPSTHAHSCNNVMLQAFWLRADWNYSMYCVNLNDKCNLELKSEVNGKY